MDSIEPGNMANPFGNNMADASNNDAFQPRTYRLIDDPTMSEVLGNMNNLEVNDVICTKCKKQFKDGEDGISCSRNPLENVQNRLEDLTINSNISIHKLCRACVIEAAVWAISHEEIIAGDGIGLNCVQQTCQRLFLASEMRHFLPKEVETFFENAMLHQSMKAVCRDNPNSHIMTCSNCHRPDLIDEGHRFHKCPHCDFYQCWVCGRLATKAHEIRSCEEMAHAEANPSQGFTKYNNIELKPPRFI